MFTRNMILAALAERNVRIETMAFYSRIDANGVVVDEPDSEHGFCDLTNKTCTVSWCVAQSLDGGTVNLQVDDDLIGGVLGKLAGAF